MKCDTYPWQVQPGPARHARDLPNDITKFENIRQFVYMGFLIFRSFCNLHLGHSSRRATTEPELCDGSAQRMNGEHTQMILFELVLDLAVSSHLFSAYWRADKHQCVCVCVGVWFFFSFLPFRGEMRYLSICFLRFRLSLRDPSTFSIHPFPIGEHKNLDAIEMLTQTIGLCARIKVYWTSTSAHLKHNQF